MTKKAKTKPIKEARKVIEKFGGIRPMASTMDVPVTTVQGWKKRNVIPATRRKAVIEAASSNDIDLSGLVEKDVANENSGLEKKSTEKDALANAGFNAEVNKAQENNDPALAARHETAIQAAHYTNDLDEIRATQEALMSKITAAERRAVQKSALITILLLALVGAFAGFLLWPQAENAAKNSVRLNALEGEVAQLKDNRSLLEGLLPENMQEQLGRLQEQARNIGARLEEYGAQAEAVARDVVGPDAGPLSERIARLEDVMAEISGSEQLAGLMDRVQNLQQSVEGQEQLSRAVTELNKTISQMQGRMDNINMELDQARQEDPALGQTLDGVSATDLKAAAMLVGLAQFRSSLNRNAPFADDLALLQKMVGTDDPALNEAISRLAPQAERGVLSPAGLSEEFKGLAGEIVVSSLEGEDVTVTEKAKARFNEILQVEKDGALVTGTDTQAAVAQAQKALEAGDVQTALTILQGLEGPAAQTAQPWMSQAEATLLAQDVQAMLTGAVLGQIKQSPATGGSREFKALINELEQIGGNKVYTDEESGITILPQ